MLLLIAFLSMTPTFPEVSSREDHGGELTQSQPKQRYNLTQDVGSWTVRFSQQVD